jgi:hypothetical protein
VISIGAGRQQGWWCLTVGNAKIRFFDWSLEMDTSDFSALTSNKAVQ